MHYSLARVRTRTVLKDQEDCQKGIARGRTAVSSQNSPKNHTPDRSDRIEPHLMV